MLYWRESAPGTYLVSAIDPSQLSALEAMEESIGVYREIFAALARELAPHNITVNCLAPNARTRMTEAAFAATMARPEAGFDAMDPANVAPVVAWLASEDSGDVTGRVLEVEGGRICVEEGWRHGPARDLGRRWQAGEVGSAVRDLLASAATPEPVYGS